MNSTQSPDIDIKQDAKRVWETLRKGGLAIIPIDVGYAIAATDPAALERAFNTKQREPHKRHSMIGSYALHKEIHKLPPREAGMTKLLVHDLDLPLAMSAPFREDHPMLQNLGAETLARCTVDETLVIFVNGGPLQDELARLSLEAGVPIMGSSANLTGQGTKSFVEDIEPEIYAAADIVINYGKMKHTTPRASSTMFDFKNVRLLRYGACFDVIQDAMRRFYGIDLPDDPGKEASFSGRVIDSTY